MTDRDKEAEKEAWMESWRLSRGGRELGPVTRRTAEEKFERWWRRERNDDD